MMEAAQAGLHKLLCTITVNSVDAWWPLVKGRLQPSQTEACHESSRGQLTLD